MPELSRFFGIIIRMYSEAGTSHHVPHFHAYYQDEVAVLPSIRWISWQEQCRRNSGDW
jgi:hypothetical protein